MKKKNTTLDQLFEKYDNQWDVETLESNHQKRFLKKLDAKKSNWKRFVTIGIAACIIMMLGLFIFNTTPKKTQELQFASKETKQTDSVFSVLIKNELEKIKEKKSPKNERIIADALKQMKALDNDYAKIIKELQTNGESKQIIYAMLSNLQTRISFLQNVLIHLENNEKFKNASDEKII